jgi:hypothetical protein
MQADGTNKHANTNLFVWFTEEPPAGEDSHMLQRDLRLHIEPENTPSPSALLAEVIWKQVLIAPTHTLGMQPKLHRKWMRLKVPCCRDCIEQSLLL